MNPSKLNIATTPLFIFATIYFVMFFFGFIHTNDVDTIEIRSKINIFGIFCHFLSVVGFGIGAYIANKTRKINVSSKREYNFNKRKFLVVLIIYCVISLAILFWQIGASVDIRDYLDRIAMSILLSEADPNARNYVLLSHDEGGISGIFKMFGFLPLSALYMFLTLQIIENQKNHLLKKGLFNTICVIVIVTSVIVRAMMTLDRGVLFYSLLIFLYYYLLQTPSIWRSFLLLLKRPWFYIGLTITLTAVSLVSEVRQGIGLLETLMKYFSLGIANLSLMYNSNFDFTFGLAVFNVIIFPLKFFELNYILPDFKEADYVWNVARYLTAYTYQDFGVFFIFFFVFFGYVATLIYHRALTRNSPYYLVILFPVIIAVIGSFSIPPMRGTEWWVSIGMAILGVKISVQIKRKSLVVNEYH